MEVRSFCFGLNIFSPFGINHQKQRFWEPFNTFSPLVQVNKSEELYQLGVLWSDGEG
jgi:gamma-glutamylcysteine synthetase